MKDLPINPPEPRHVCEGEEHICIIEILSTFQEDGEWNAEGKCDDCGAEWGGTTPQVGLAPTLDWKWELLDGNDHQLCPVCRETVQIDWTDNGWTAAEHATEPEDWDLD